jgi:predicted dehydrogenase
MDKIKYGVLGVSNHLLKRIILPLQNTQHSSIYGIASRDKTKAQKFAEDFDIDKCFDSYEAMLADKNINAVYIPLPNHMHKEWVIKAARAGKHVLCEKPLTLNASEAEEVLKVEQEMGVNIMEAFMYPFHPQWIHTLNMIRTNQIGKIQYIHTSFSYNNPASGNIRNIKEYGGGGLMDIGCYAISASRFLFQQEPQRVISLCKNHPSFQTDIISSAILDFNGAHATFTVSTLSYANQSVEIVGTGGKISIHIPFNTYVDTKATITVSTPQGDRDIEFDTCDQYGLMFEAFSKAILKQEKAPHAMTNTMNNMKVIDAIFKSNTTQMWETV